MVLLSVGNRRDRRVLDFRIWVESLLSQLTGTPASFAGTPDGPPARGAPENVIVLFGRLQTRGHHAAVAADRDLQQCANWK
jgi:hypothetical protein